jgi:hypothetical protein
MNPRETGTIGRRHAIRGAALGAAALIADRFVRPDPAHGANGDTVKLGQANQATSETQIYNGQGVTSAAVLAASWAGVSGTAWNTGGWGLHGSAQGTNGVGLFATTSGHQSQIAVDAVANSGNGEGYAVRARTKNGVALYGQVTGTGGFGLQVDGPAVFSRSGRVTIPAGQSSVTVTGHSIIATTLVIATIQGNVASRYVRGVSVNDAANTFTIRLNKVAPTGGVVVGYFIVN